MRIVLLVSAAIACASNSACADELLAGFLTFGCGDSYFKRSAASETWFVDLPPKREQQVLELANIDLSEVTWRTLFVEIEGRAERKPRRGYFSEHPKELIVTRFVTARYPEVGESVKAATESAKRLRGYLVLGDELAGFAPLEQGDELWWFVPGMVGWDQINKLVPPTKEDPYGALVEVVGRVGPPGAYGHLQMFVREIAIDELTYLRLAPASELKSTVAVATFGFEADIQKCKQQR